MAKLAEYFVSMTPKAFATIMVRILGVWLLLEAFFGLVSVWLLYCDITGSAGVHRRYYDGGQQIADGGLHFLLHTTYYTASQFAPSLVSIGIRVVFGVVLVLASKPMARFFSRGVE